MAPHSSTLAWKIPWTEEPGRLQSMQSLRADTTERLHFHFSLCCIREGNGNPLQCSCLENPRDGGAWWAAVYGVTQSRTRLKRLSSSSSSKQNLEVSWVICKKERAAWQKEEQTVFILDVIPQRILGEYHSIGLFSVFNLKMLLGASASGF